MLKIKIEVLSTSFFSGEMGLLLQRARARRREVARWYDTRSMPKRLWWRREACALCGRRTRSEVRNGRDEGKQGRMPKGRRIHNLEWRKHILTYFFCEKYLLFWVVFLDVHIHSIFYELWHVLVWVHTILNEFCKKEECQIICIRGKFSPVMCWVLKREMEGKHNLMARICRLEK